MKAIETRYKGYRFRSRLEARWAVCFDALGIPWEYEAQGYETTAGAYLPDFTLWGSLAAEVKPESRELVGEALPRLRAFCRDNDQSLVMLIGTPEVRWYALLTPGSREYIDFGMAASKQRAWFSYSGPEWPSPNALSYSAAFRRAVESARGARFEHGETVRLPEASRADLWRSRPGVSPERRKLTEQLASATTDAERDGLVAQMVELARNERAASRERHR
jgi:hypothetical protein